MYLFLSLMPATLALVVGYFILFSSSKAQGMVRILGRALAAWILLMAVGLPLAGAYATYADFPDPGEVMRSMHGR